MRRLATLILTAAVGLGLASSAEAGTLEWSGTLIVKLPIWGDLRPFVHFGTGVATINGSAGGGHINTIGWTRGLSFTGGNNVPETIPLTGPQNPTVVTLRATGFRLGTLTLNGISGGPPLGSKNTGVQPGRMKFCVLFPGCGAYLPIPIGTKGGDAVGVGGMITVNTFSKGGGFHLSVWGAPWTIGVASIRNVTTETPNGGISTYTKTIQGFVHGPASGSSTAAISGVLQIVTPVRIQTSGDSRDNINAGWVEVRLHFIPEPGLLLLLGSGAAGLLMLGRSRTRG
jgi:hypothetical protein